ncbi:hypothetical protein [Roseateles sp.]|uniref:hypothetical protein n=1 Tax=Roseateles sp. TaxID=1971397 RepID=UPI002F423104
MTHRRRRNPRHRSYKRMDNALAYIDTVIARTGLLTARQRLDHLAPFNSAMSLLRTGAGTAEAVANLVDGLNIAAELCKLRICNDRRGDIAAGLQALIALSARAQSTGTWCLLTSEIEPLEEAVFIHAVQVDHCSSGEFQSAIAAVIAMTRQALAGHAAPGVAVVDPLTQGANASEAAALLAAST